MYKPTMTPGLLAKNTYGSLPGDICHGHKEVVTYLTAAVSMCHHKAWHVRHGDYILRTWS